MKKLILLAILAVSLTYCTSGPTWSEEFNGNTFDTTIWSKIERGGSQWNKNMALDDSLFRVENGCLVLRGVMTPDSMIHTAGLDSHGKKFFRYGRYEIRAKLPRAHGAWPALWMIPEDDQRNRYGEIDICEKLNFDDSAYQTVHTELNLPGDKYQKKSAKGAINPDDFNIYGVELYKDSLRFFTNDTYTLTYYRMTKGPDGEDIPATQWTLDRDWHFILSMQIGAPWPGEARLEELPIEMEIDWIHFYEFKDQN